MAINNRELITNKNKKLMKTNAVAIISDVAFGIDHSYRKVAKATITPNEAMKSANAPKSAGEYNRVKIGTESSVKPCATTLALAIFMKFERKRDAVPSFQIWE